MERKVREQGHVVVVVAEGSGQSHVQASREAANAWAAGAAGAGPLSAADWQVKHDASGHALLDDVGAWLVNKVFLLLLVEGCLLRGIRQGGMWTGDIRFRCTNERALITPSYSHPSLISGGELPTGQSLF